MAEARYKLLIADDEYWTREKIRKMIDWKDYGLEFLSPAENGEQVMEKMEREKPDILITDINMPFINGVELVKLIKEKYPEVVVFVISGYDDFEYVKSTLMSGAINYLLKPITKMDLVNALSKALEIISREEVNRLEALKASSLIQDRELSMLVEKEETSFASAVTMNTDVDFAGCCLILIKIHNFQELMARYHYDMNYLSYEVKRRIKEITMEENLLVFNHIYRSNEFIIITEAEHGEQKKMIFKLVNSLQEELGLLLTVAVSGQSYSIESIHTAYNQSVSVFMTREYRRENKVLFSISEEAKTEKDMRIRISDEEEKRLKSLLKSGNAPAVSELIFEIIGLAHCEEQNWQYLEVKQTVKRICNILMDYAVWSFSENLQEAERRRKYQNMDSLVELADKTIEKLENRQLCEVLKELMELALETSREEATGSIRDMVKKAVNYIETNFFEELTLVSLSKKYGVESSYFSKMFRQETGDNLMSFIAKKRIEKAKEYMADSKINLTEIAFMVGYDDYTYFNRVFRKLEGESPREFRNGTEKP